MIVWFSNCTLRTSTSTSLALSLLFSMFVWLLRKSGKLKPKSKKEKDKPTNHLWAYGLLTLDPPPQNSKRTSPPTPTTPPTRFTLSERSPYGLNPSLFGLNPSSTCWCHQLMVGLDNLNTTDSLIFFKNLNIEKICQNFWMGFMNLVISEFLGMKFG